MTHRYPYSKNIPLTQIWDVVILPGQWVATVAAKQLPQLSELSQLEVFHVHLGHPVDEMKSGYRNLYSMFLSYPFLVRTVKYVLISKFLRERVIFKYVTQTQSQVRNNFSRHQGCYSRGGSQF